MAKERSTTKMHRMCKFPKEKNTKEFLKENEKNLYASELSNISSEVGAFGSVQMFNHIFLLIRKLDYGKDWCFIGRCLYYADKFNNHEVISEIIKYVEERNLEEESFYYTEKAYDFYDNERDGQASKVLTQYFDYTDLLDRDWIHDEIKEILVKQKLYKDLQENLPPKEKSKSNKI